jgi:hypothetical protein
MHITLWQKRKYFSLDVGGCLYDDDDPPRLIVSVSMVLFIGPVLWMRMKSFLREEKCYVIAFFELHGDKPSSFGEDPARIMTFLFQYRMPSSAIIILINRVSGL